MRTKPTGQEGPASVSPKWGWWLAQGQAAGESWPRAAHLWPSLPYPTPTSNPSAPASSVLCPTGYPGNQTPRLGPWGSLHPLPSRFPPIHTHTHTHSAGPAPGRCEQKSAQKLKVKQRAFMPSEIPERLPLDPQVRCPWGRCLALARLPRVCKAHTCLSPAMGGGGPSTTRWSCPSPAHPPSRPK